MKKLLVLIALPVLLFAAPSAEELFQQGNELYREAKFKEAAQAYESILEQGSVSAEVYFNLGNTYFRLGNFSRAILSYERAARLKPGDGDIQHNLKLVSLRIVDRIDPVPELFLVQWMRSATSTLSSESSAAIFTMAWMLCLGSLSLLTVSRAPSVLKITRTVFLISLPVVLLTGIFFGVQQVESAKQNTAIITSQVVTAKSSPDEQSVDAFVVHEGLKVSLSDAVGDWVKIVLPDGKVGWVKAGQCEKI